MSHLLPSRALALEKEEPGDWIELDAVDGPPGTGKTSELIATLGRFPSAGCATFSTSAAREVLIRSATANPWVGTIYSLSWPGQALVAREPIVGRREQPWKRRAPGDALDPLLRTYALQTAQTGRRQDEALLASLMAWSGPPEPCPLPLDHGGYPVSFRYALALARWLAAWTPWPEGCEPPPSTLLLDEAQDLGMLEMAACLALVRLGAELRGERPQIVAFLDPGQSIYNKYAPSEKHPPAWKNAGRHHRLTGGYRVGHPAASLASEVLRGIFWRAGTTFAAPHATSVEEWDGDASALPEGVDALVLGRSCATVASAFESYGRPDIPIVSRLREKERLGFATIHDAKGSEADQVFLLPWPRGARQRLREGDPAEWKCLYVALTRASRSVWIPPDLYEIIRGC